MSRKYLSGPDQLQNLLAWILDIRGTDQTYIYPVSLPAYLYKLLL